MLKSNAQPVAGVDQRGLSRKRLNASLRVFDRRTGHRIGRLVDITMDGLMIVSSEPIEIDSIFQFSMVLPCEIKSSSTVSFTAKSIWCKNANYSHHFGTGFLIEDMFRDDVEILEKLIRGY